MLPFKGKAYTRPLAILHRKGRVLTPAMKKFIDVLGLDLPAFGPALGLPPAEYDPAKLRADLLPAPKHPRWQAALVP
jgi:hypothetical protein